MARIPVEEEDELETETLDDGDEDEDLAEPGENMNWPTAFAYMSFFLMIVLMWHDCCGRH
jgi:hypothetical protein